MTSTCSWYRAPDRSHREVFTAASQRCQDVAVLTLITASVLNALERDGNHCLTEYILRFMPKDPHPLIEFITQFSTASTTPQLLCRFGSEYVDVTVALRTCVARQPISKHTSDEGFAIVACAWRGFAGSVAQVIETFARIQAVEHTRPIAWARLAGLLAVTRDGGSPCGLHGEIALPSDIDRRRNCRKKVYLEAVAQRACGVATVLVTDISIRGLGLDLLQNPCPGETVTIILHSGRRFSGTVVWCTSERAGVSFDQELHEQDPIFKFCGGPNRSAPFARRPRTTHLVQLRDPM